MFNVFRGIRALFVEPDHVEKRHILLEGARVRLVESEMILERAQSDVTLLKKRIRRLEEEIAKEEALNETVRIEMGVRRSVPWTSTETAQLIENAKELSRENARAGNT
jgi:hypothetical protein